MQVSKIVLTGGPCAGKTTALSRLTEEFSELGYHVVCVPEAATELIQNGITPNSFSTMLEFQKILMELQLQKEKIFEQASKQLNKDKVLIICDRGVLDHRAYISSVEFDQCLNELNLNRVLAWGLYDAVFHLETAAKGAQAYYTTSNNSARTETPEEAINIDNKLIHAYAGHPHFRVIGNEGTFEDKQRRLFAEVASFLGEPTPLEIERKFLIKYPDISQLLSNPNCKKVEIIQTYLKSNDNSEIRVRQRGLNGDYSYYKTEKKSIDSLHRVEVESQISEREYLASLMNADPLKHPVRKDRYCLMDNGQYFEIDIYPFWKDKAIMELELSSEDQKIIFPKEVTVIKEVTNDDQYRNSNLASQ